MKKYLFLLFSMVLNAYAGEVIITDSDTHAPIERVKVELLNGKNQKRNYSDKHGKYLINQAGKYIFKFSKLGYYDLTDTLEIGSTPQLVSLKPRFFKSDDIVVTGQYSPASMKESVRPISLIGTQQLERHASSSLRDLLITESGIRLEQDNMLGTEMKINGIAGANVKIMIDEIPVIGKMNDYIDISQINLSNVEKIEIIDGPMSGVYGSDALGGVINIITKKPETEKIGGNANLYYESVGVYNADATAELSTGNFKFMLSGGRNLFQGYDEDDNLRDKDWNPKEQYFADLKAHYDKNSLKLRYSGQYFNEYILNRGMPRSPYFETAFDDKYHTSRLTNSINAEKLFGKSSKLNATSAISWYQRRKNTFFKDLTTLDETLTKTASDQDTTEFKSYLARLTYSDDKLTDDLKYQLGFDFTSESATGKKIRDNEQSITDYAVFAGLEYAPCSFFKVLPTIRFQENNRYDAPIIPSINFRMQAADNLFFRLGWAKGFRAPGIKELFMQFVDMNHDIHGNEDLKAEKSDNFNLSANYSTEFSGNFFEIEPKFFYNKIDNLITLAEISSGTYNYVNIGEYESVGGNLSVKYFAPGFSVTLTGGLTGTSSLLYEINPDADKFDFSPDASVSVDYLLESIDTQFNIFYKFSGKSISYNENDDNTISEYELDSYNILDINLSKNITENLSLQIGGKNLFNVKNVKRIDTNLPGSVEEQLPIMWGTTFFAKLSFRI